MFTKSQRFGLPADETPEGGAAPAAPTGGDDITRLNIALNKERELREKAERALKTKQEAEELSSKTLSDQVVTLNAQLADAQTKLQTVTAEYNSKLSQQDAAFKFSEALQAAGILPEYRDRFADVPNSLKLEGDQLKTADGKAFDAAELRNRYPAMFAANLNGAGSGATSSSSPAPAGAARVVKSTDLEAIAGIDVADLESGKVIIQ